MSSTQKSQTLAQLKQARMEEKQVETQSNNRNHQSPSKSRSKSISSSAASSEQLSSYIRNIGDNSLLEENIRVVCRFRPINKKERHEEKTNRLQDFPIQYKKNNSTIIIPRERYKNNLEFTLDRIMKPTTSQDDAFKILAQPLVEQVMTGYNCTIFAYGQTGSGKVPKYSFVCFVFLFAF